MFPRRSKAVLIILRLEAAAVQHWFYKASLPLAVQKLPSQVIVDGGTYCPQAPTGEFFAESLVPRMNRMGYSIEANIEKFGFYKAGGGQISVACNSPKQFRPVDLVRREKLRNCTVQLITSHFPEKRRSRSAS